MMWTEEKLQEHVWSSKKLRRIYEVVTRFGGGRIHTDYEGKITKLGDSVQIRVRPKLFTDSPQYLRVTIDTILSKTLPIQSLLNLIDWEAEGGVVVTYLDGVFVAGYAKL